VSADETIICWDGAGHWQEDCEESLDMCGVRLSQNFAIEPTSFFLVSLISLCKSFGLESHGAKCIYEAKRQGHGMHDDSAILFPPIQSA
jgi:hypothetical protein